MQYYTVIIEEVITREYSVEATSKGSAESIALQWKEDGEPGTVINTEVLHVEAARSDKHEFDQDLPLM